MAKVDVQAEEMDRALEAPDILANLTFGGAMVTTNGVGMIMNPMGLSLLVLEGYTDLLLPCSSHAYDSVCERG